MLPTYCIIASSFRFDVTLLKWTLGRYQLCWERLFLPWIRYDSW